MASVMDNQPESRPGPDAGAARAAVDEARRLLQSGDPDGAAAALHGYATRADAPPAELSDAAKVMLDAGSPIDAIARYLEAGRGFLDAGDVQSARQNFAAAYETDGKNMDVLFELGRTDVADGKKHDALDKFVEVLRKSNLKHLPALYEAGCLYELDGQHNQAILAFKRVVERDKTHVSAFEHLGTLHQIRKQLPDAIANYVRASEAAQARYQYADAKRLAEAALAIDSAHPLARRAHADAERALETGGAPAPAASAPQGAAPQPAPVPAAPAPAQRPAQSSQVSEVTPVVPPNAEGAIPPPPPSTLSIGLPTEVALLEQQSQAMAQLAQVQNAVAQTYRQRMALDEEIKKAEAALEALHRQQQTVEEDLSSKRDELAQVVAEREAEEATLAALGDAIAKSKADLEALRTLQDMIGEVKAKCAETSGLVTKTRADADGVAGDSADVKAKTAAVQASIDELTARLAAAKQATEAHERQIAELSGGVKSAHEVSAAADAQVGKTKAALDALAGQHGAVEAASEQLGAVAKTVDAKLAEADAAIKRLEALQVQRKSQFDEIVFKLTPLVGDLPSVPSAAPAGADASASPAAPSASSATATATKAAPAKAAASPIEALIAAGKFADAVHRAQADANGQPKPADYLVDTGLRLREAGRIDDAVKLFASARDRDQGSTRARFELGSALVDLGRTDEALGVLQSVESVPEYAVLGQVAIGKCLRRQGDLEAAETRFSKALEVEGRPDDDYHQALYELADLHESKGDPESLGLALWSYEELQSGNPNYGDVAQRVAKLKARLADAPARSEPVSNGAVKQ